MEMNNGIKLLDQRIKVKQVVQFNKQLIMDIFLQVKIVIVVYGQLKRMKMEMNYGVIVIILKIIQQVIMFIKQKIKDIY